MQKLKARKKIEKFLKKKRGQKFERKEICKKTKIAWTTAFDNLNALRRQKIIVRERQEPDSRGRPKELWFIPRG